MDKENKIDTEEAIATTTLAILSIPTLILNTVGSIVSAIWLIFIGQWQLVLGGVIIMIVATIAAALLLVLVGFLAIPMGAALEHKKTGVLKLLAILYSILLAAVATLVSFVVFAWQLEKITPENTIPLLIWTFVVALAPWSYMASKERSQTGFFADGAVNATSIIGIGLVVALLIFQIQHLPLTTIFLIFWIIVSIGLVIFTLIPLQRLNTESMKKHVSKK